MLFNSFTFLCFFLIVLILHYTLPEKLRWVMLLIASCVFYMFWSPKLIVLILFTAFSAWIFGRAIEKTQSKKKLFLSFVLVINFGILLFFKYLVFFNEVIKGIYTLLGLSYPIEDFSIILPMGISFYTFQAMGYVIDIYRGEYKAEKNFFKFVLFITFFPQLVAGPIERADKLLPQLFTRKRFEAGRVSLGLKYMLIGFFKKVVIADRAMALVNTVYNDPHSFAGGEFILATLFFAIQIYCDFSGYSDIAIGCAKTLGIDLMENFRCPYFSKSIKEFWRRWHISLSTWFKDYLYIPLGGNRAGEIRRYFNLFVTFLVSGLWHGANYTFILWGALHGIYQIIGSLKDKLFKGLRLDNFVVNFLKRLITFILVCFAWILFRANTISDAVYIISNLTSGFDSYLSYQGLYNAFNSLGIGYFDFILLCGSILLLWAMDFISYLKGKSFALLTDRLPFVFRFAFYYGLTAIILLTGVFSSGGEFIYFQF